MILEEIRQGTDDPARSVAQSLFATAYVAHPYRRPVIGTAESVQRLGERELVEFFRSYYVADNLTLVVAGDVDPARVRRSVERRFRAMPAGRPARRVAGRAGADRAARGRGASRRQRGVPRGRVSRAAGAPSRCRRARRRGDPARRERVGAAAARGCAIATSW